MPNVPMRRGEVWQRQTPVEPDDGWNRVRVVGQFGDEVTITPADSFGGVIPVTPQSLALSYECIEQAARPAAPGSAEAETELVANGGEWGARAGHGDNV